MPWKMAFRDVLLVMLTIVLWGVDAGFRGADGWVAGVVAVGAGLMAAVCGFLVHEWGHFLGARTGGSSIHRSDRVLDVFLFRFDSDANNRSQFLKMSFGGFLASAAVVVLYAVMLPADALSGKIALLLVALGVVATFILEFPVAWRVARGAPLPQGAAYKSAATE
jgi:hypothetical protein